MPSQGDSAAEEREAIGGDGRQPHDRRLRDPAIDIVRGIAVVTMLSVSDLHLSRACLSTEGKSRWSHQKRAGGTILASINRR